MTDPLDRLLSQIEELSRLEQLTARELVFEMLGRDSADDLHVTELMNRVLPGWTSEFSREELGG